MSRTRSYAVATTDTDALRQEVLMPFLERLCLSEGRLSLPATERRLGFSAELLDLDPWEQEVLETALRRRAGEPADACSCLMAEGVAFQAKCLTQFGRLEDPAHRTPDAWGSFCEELVVDAAVGIALLEELQREIDTFVREGELERAKRLSGFRNKLVRNVKRLKEAIGAEGARRAEAHAATMIAPVESGPGAGVSLELPDWARTPTRRSKAQTKRRRPEPPMARTQRRTNRLAWLTALLIVACGAWLALILPAQLARVELQVLETRDFASVPEVASIQARPPSLFVRVDGVRWNDADRERRLAAIESIGAIAARAGYSGAHVTDSGGVAVASWTEGRGPRLIQTAEGR